MARGGSKPGQRRGGRRPGTPNKPKGETALVVLDKAENEVRVLVARGDKITALGKDRLAELDQWAHGLAQTPAPPACPPARTSRSATVAKPTNRFGCAAKTCWARSSFIRFAVSTAIARSGMP